MGNLRLSSKMKNISMQQLKEQRLTPAEKFVLETISGARSATTDLDGYILWYKNGTFIFHQNLKKGKLMVDTILQMILKEGFGLDYDEIQVLLNKLLYKFTNNGQLEVVMGNNI
jgi:hypothetical protein